jgi:lysophospholipase L1-like esterase
MRVKSVVGVVAILFALLPFVLSAPGFGQAAPGSTLTPGITVTPPITIKWEVKSRFRLFKNEDDFEYMVRFHGHDGVLADETVLAGETKGIGWASRFVTRLCVTDGSCTRTYSTPNSPSHESFNEPYLAPDYHRIGVTAEGAPTGAQCTWRFVADGSNAVPNIAKDQPCGNEVFARVPYGKTTHVQLFVATTPDRGEPTATTDVAVRDILIAGLGDSTASGEGNPDREIGLDTDGFCFRRFGAGESGSYFRPSRRGYDGDRSCSGDAVSAGEDDTLNWFKQRAVWMDAACHRSLYSYQIRVALTLAIENPQIAVTYIPLGCSGATIANGMLGDVEARESDCIIHPTCSRFVKGQMDALQQIMSAAHRSNRSRNLDLVLLTIGANDIGFSGLIANVMFDRSAPEFGIFSAAARLATPATASEALQTLPGQFAGLRDRLRPLVDNRLDHVIYVSYGHPGLYNNGQPCPQGRQGFDVHPAFTIDGALLKSASDFVVGQFFPRLRAIATCGPGGGCQSERDRMTFVDEHQAQFRSHGFCAQSNNDPAFDRGCFRRDGKSFTTDLTQAPSDPMSCHKPPNFFRAYDSRERWIRTANDSYFAAMTYPDADAKFLQPQNIHDPIWGAASAVYGGAMHPTAQGHAAMADAALPAARRLLGLPASK